MARIWLPPNSSVARAARGWPAPGEQPELNVELDFRNSYAGSVRHFITMSQQMRKGTTALDVTAFDSDGLAGFAAGGWEKPGEFTLAAGNIDRSDTSSGAELVGMAVGSDYQTKTLFGGVSEFTILANLKWLGSQSTDEDCILGSWGLPGSEQVLFRYDSNSQELEAFINNGTTTYSGTASLSRTDAAKYNWLGLTYNGSELVIWINGDPTTAASVSTTIRSGTSFARWGVYQLDFDSDPAARTDAGRFAMKTGVIALRAFPREYMTDPYQLLQPANQTPFLINTAAAGGITGTGALSAQTSAISGTGEIEHTGTGDLDAQASSVAGAGEVEHTGTGDLDAQASTIAGTGAIGGVVTGTGDLDAQTSQIAGTGEIEHTGTGDLDAQVSQVSGTGAIEGAISGTGDFAAQVSTVDGTGVTERVGTGALVASAADVIGAGTITGPLTGTGDLDAQVSQVSGIGAITRVGAGDLGAQASTIAGTGAVTQEITGTGALEAQASQIDGFDVLRIWTEIDPVTTTWTEIT